MTVTFTDDNGNSTTRRGGDEVDSILRAMVDHLRERNRFEIAVAVAREIFITSNPDERITNETRELESLSRKILKFYTEKRKAK